MNYLIHATPVHPSLCLQYLTLLFTVVTSVVFILLLLLPFCYCYYYKTVATDKLLRASLFPGAAELTTNLLRLTNILWLPLCWINKFRFYFPPRRLRSSTLVGHHLSVKFGNVYMDLWFKSNLEGYKNYDISAFCNLASFGYQCFCRSATSWNVL
jgi:hypothetical protein